MESAGAPLERSPSETGTGWQMSACVWASHAGGPGGSTAEESLPAGGRLHSKTCCVTKLAKAQSMHSSMNFLCSLPAWSGKQATLPPLWTYGSTGHCYNMNWREHVSLTNQGRHCIPVYAAKQHRGLPGIRARRGVPSVPRGAGAQCVGSSGGTTMSCSDSSCSRSGLRGRLSCSGAICSQTPRTFAQHLPAMIVPAL